MASWEKMQDFLSLESGLAGDPQSESVPAEKSDSVAVNRHGMLHPLSGDTGKGEN
jgi:hypothetical protein